MNLKPEELVKVLLYCGNGGSCDVCCRPNLGEHREFEWRCLGPLLLHTASQIERDQKEIDELRKELEQERRWRQGPPDAGNTSNTPESGKTRSWSHGCRP